MRLSLLYETFDVSCCWFHGEEAAAKAVATAATRANPLTIKKMGVKAQNRRGSPLTSDLLGPFDVFVVL